MGCHLTAAEAVIPVMDLQHLIMQIKLLSLTMGLVEHFCIFCFVTSLCEYVCLVKSKQLLTHTCMVDYSVSDREKPFEMFQTIDSLLAIKS